MRDLLSRPGASHTCSGQVMSIAAHSRPVLESDEDTVAGRALRRREAQRSAIPDLRRRRFKSTCHRTWPPLSHRDHCVDGPRSWLDTKGRKRAESLTPGLGPLNYSKEL